ncbi:hypothetical protein PILCRDRAFT_6734 [Piloderma croceum F 1598]|uniref:CxC6 like cysteine cluster associated with KDZ domain-containing protein n=1 Tax=Piloderma croceum (strain F 1598) TaxID=765440 RepID=A0A0C3C2P5_PILCF|nr:hypothetical protein PILCRDRAFT_6734 [Piloderma croceum F 1598]
MDSSSVLKTTLVLNALINTKKLQIESQLMILLQVPALVGEDAELAIQDAARARLNAQLAAQARSNADDAMDVDESSQTSSSDVEASSQSSSTEEASPVTLVVMDGVVMGSTHYAFDDCIEELKNARGGVFCA